MQMGYKEKLYFLWWGILAECIAPRAKASTLALHPVGEYIGDEIRRTGRHYELANLLKVSLICRVQYFIDVGANIGNHSHFFASLGAKGAAFEP